MKFECPHCRQHLEADTASSGMRIACPRCGTRFAMPGKPAAARPPPPSATAAAVAGPQAGAQSPAAAPAPARDATGGMTIAQFMSAQGIADGGVDLSNPAAAPSRVIVTDLAARYDLGDVVTSGGMGDILDARDMNIRRRVAMKVMRDREQAAREDVVRFIEEAQVTGQLEHPGIVPVHELGVDDVGNVFYTMKFVRGVTLKHVFERLAAGDAQSLAEHPLPQLLTVFQKVCDAVAFAHSKRVIHRDLKPDNIMIGEYGEVLVVDWGLAKMLGPAERRLVVKGSPAQRRSEDAAIHRARDGRDAGALATQAGVIMGTPGFMAPEQARGDTEHVDERADVYSLGAILYDMLTLRPPVSGGTIEEVLRKVTAGELTPPALCGTGAGRRGGAAAALPHLPGGRVPDSLAAVAMKALALRPEDRYASVKALQADVAAYQNGFATSAERAGAWKQFRLFIRRNRAFSASALVVLLLVCASSWVNLTERRKAVAALRSFEQEQVRRMAERRTSAPAFVQAARVALESRDFVAAMAQAGVAVESDPRLPEARLLHAQLLIHRRQYAEAIPDLAFCAAAAPQDRDIAQLLALCRRAAGPGDRADALGVISDIFARQGVPALALAAAQSRDQQLAAHRQSLVKALGIEPYRLRLSAEGQYELDIRHVRSITDALPLKGIPIVQLDAWGADLVSLAPLASLPLRRLKVGCPKDKDLSPLASLQINELAFDGRNMTPDLSPLVRLPLASLELNDAGDATPVLKGMKLARLCLMQTRLDTLDALSGMPLNELRLNGYERNFPGIKTLEALRGMPLAILYIEGPPVSDLSPLRGMQLRQLGIRAAANITDLSPLAGMPLERLELGGCPYVTSVAALRGMPLQALRIERCAVPTLEFAGDLPKLTDLNVRGATKIADLSPLRKTGVQALQIEGCREITDVAPLAGTRIARLGFSPWLVRTGMDRLKSLPSLQEILVGGRAIGSAEFWQRYAAGEFREPPDRPERKGPGK